MATTLTYATVFTPTEVLKRSAVVVSDSGKITYVGPMEDAPSVEGVKLDMRGRIVIPGLIDIHVHGGNGINLGVTDSLPDKLDEDLIAYSKYVAKTGVVGFLCGILLPSAKMTVDLINAYVPLFEVGTPGAEALGLYLEGPFMNVEMKGAIDPAWLHDPDIDEARALLDAGKGWIRQMSLAPELPNADEVASMYRKAGVVLSLAHTIADYETARAALSGNWTNITHTFNKMTGLHHRKPGVVGAVLGSDEVTAELIADTIHVHPAVMKILIRCLGTDRVVIITDATALAGLPDGTYDFNDRPIYIKDGAARIEAGNLAGSTATMNRCVGNMNKVAGVSLMDAVKMGSLNPARAMGFADRLGSIAVGKDASLAVIDEDVNVYLTMVKGKIVHNNL